jgi:hypothetical protein
MEVSVRKVALAILLFCSTFSSGILLKSEAQAQTTSQNPNVKQEGLDSVESSALATLRQIIAAEERFKAASRMRVYGTIKELSEAGLIEFADFNYPIRGGYLFTSEVDAVGGYRIAAVPLDLIETGKTTKQVFLATGVGITLISPEMWLRLSKAKGMAENEAKAISRIRTLGTAEATYQATDGKGLFFTTIDQLARIGTIDQRLASGQIDGYQFSIVVSRDRKGFEIFAVPVVYGVSGVRSFYSSNKYEIRGADKRGMKATPFDPIIE